MREGWNAPHVDLSVVSSHGGLGDMIARLPAFRYVHKNYKHVSQTIYYQDYFVDLARYLLPEDERLKYKKLSECPFMLKKPYVNFDPERLTTLQLHLTTHAFLMMLDQVPPDARSMSYPKSEYVFYSRASALNQELHEMLTETPCVVVTTGYTAESRAWPAAHVNTLGRKLREQGLTPVLLGSKEPMVTGNAGDDIKTRYDDEIKADLFADLRGKTSLIEALGVMQRAKAVVGVDNGLLHLAHCTDTPVVYGLTTLKPEHRIPFRIDTDLYNRTASLAWRDDDWYAKHGLTEVLESSVPCGGCQSRGFAINHDWRTCLFDDYSCTLTLTADRFLAKLDVLGVIR